MKRCISLLVVLFAMVAVLPPANAKEFVSHLNPKEAVEYLIITPVRYAAIFQQLADWKTSKGVPAKVITLEEILKASPTGDVPFRIREFLKDAYKTWNVKWILLGADTEDSEGKLILPRYVHSTLSGGENIPSDLYFANFDGTWDGNNNGVYGELKDNVDLAPEVHIGRASVDSREEASVFVQKVLAYEKNPPRQWVRKALLVGANLDINTSGQKEIEVLEKEVFQGFKLEKTSEDKGTSSDKVKSLMDNFNPHFVNVIAHGAPEGFEANGFFNLEEADKLQNTFPFIYTAMSCLTSYFDKDCLAEHFMANPKGGAVAYWACSRYGWYQPRNEGYYYSTLLIKDFYQLLFRDPKDVSNHMGEAITRARMKYIPEANKADGAFRWVIFGMNLLGDPEMPVWTDEPGQLKGSCKIDEKKQCISVSVTDGDKKVENALVCLRYQSDQAADLTITAKNKIPKVISIPLAANPGLYTIGRTDSSGEVTLSLSTNQKAIEQKIDDLARLDQALTDIEAYMKKIRSNSKDFEKLTRDYRFLQGTMERSRLELRAFFRRLCQQEDWTLIEQTLQVLEARVQANPKAIAQFQFSLKALTDKMRFDLAQMQQDKSGIQTRIFKKVVELNQGALGTTPGNVPPQSESGRISVTSDPVGAEVYLNNVPKGVTPCVIERVPFGTYGLKLKAQGFGAVSQEIRVSEPKTLKLNFPLKSRCSVEGIVVFENGTPCNNAIVQVEMTNSETGKQEAIASGTPDAKGHFHFFDLPKKDLYLTAVMEGYNYYYKPLNFSQKDQEFQRNVQVEMVPLCEISGSDPSLADANVCLFKYVKPKYSQIDVTKADKNGAFKFSKVRRNKYRLIASKPGCNVGVADLSVLDGKNATAQVACPPIKSVLLYIFANDKWNRYAMTADDKMLYSCKVSLNAQKKIYYYVFFLNMEDHKKDEPETLAMNPNASGSYDLGSIANTLKLEKDEEISFSFDGKSEPQCWFETKEDGKDGKVVKWAGISDQVPQLK
ncbi:MAG: C25 family cysteine peptidase [Candidatus Ozemobacteraceae bacterium]